ncbi:MAG: hypothetical protein COA62_00075 [Rhodobiaceae bacterium]|nr:MAG: hypothetical protein COA62_00075 [Rhodobiaceae bacterium]
MTELDVVGTVKEAYKGAWSHFADMMKLVWAPVALYATANVLYAGYIQGKLGGVEAEDMISTMTKVWGWQVVAMFLLGLFLWPIIAVAWHRFVLLGETTSSAIYFKFGQREARFLLTTIFLSLLPMPGVLIVIVGAGTALSLVALPIGLVLIVAGAVYALRLSLLLPAIATDAIVDARSILEATEGNVLRIISTHMLNLLCLVFLALAISLVGTVVAAFVGGVGTAIINTLLNVFGQIISVAILSIMYRDLILGAAPLQADNNSQPPLN